MFLGNGVQKYMANFRTPIPKNTSAGLLLIFSELLALENKKSNVSIHINKMKSNFFFPWPYNFYLHNPFDVWLVF